MKYTTIPHGIRTSVCRHAFNSVLLHAVAEFKRKNPQPFQSGDVVALPTVTQTLFGRWEVFDPGALNNPLPPTAKVQSLFVNTMYADETVFYYDARKFDDITNLAQYERTVAATIHGRLYWSVNLTGVPFTWPVPAAFLSLHHNYIVT
jgi:hypothetical protein